MQAVTRFPSPVHRIVVRDYDRCCHVEGLIIVTPDGAFREVEPLTPRPMSWEEMGRAMMEDNPSPRDRT